MVYVYGICSGDVTISHQLPPRKQINRGLVSAGVCHTDSSAMRGPRHDVQMRVPCVQKAKERLEVTKANLQMVKIGWFLKHGLWCCPF